MPIRKTDPVQLAAIAVVAVGAATILGAWAFEYAGYPPCPLCLDQRIPYYVGIPLALVCLIVARARPGSWPARALIGIVGLLFLGGAVLAAYHAGVEWKWWPGPADCAAGAGGDVTTGNLLDSLQSTPLVRCDEAALRILGLSLAGYNVLISLALAAVSLRAAFRR
ncbi:disulfide bond formation protein B [Microbaculum marinum]|uniref:Disulfide bond formation protein B n=1 Tax=Microbaculum marinum TaxID=1764581 RepID=A0AAW9RDE3_9HYPH